MKIQNINVCDRFTISVSLRSHFLFSLLKNNFIQRSLIFQSILSPLPVLIFASIIRNIFSPFLVLNLVCFVHFLDTMLNPAGRVFLTTVFFLVIPLYCFKLCKYEFKPLIFRLWQDYLNRLSLATLANSEPRSASLGQQLVHILF